MLSPWLLPGILFVALLALCGLAYLLMAGIRTWNLGECWYCGAEKVRPSKSRRWMDTAVGVLLLKPYRCAGCLTRFYGFRTSSLDPSPQTVPAPLPVQTRLFPIRVRVIVRVPALTTWESFREWLTEVQDAAELNSVT
jgi:hypothetical protein